MKTALLLGGNGFLGSNLTDVLLAEGWKVRVLDRGPGRWRAPLPEVAYWIGDWTNQDLMRVAMSGTNVVFQLISSTVPQTSNEDPAGDIKSNLADSIQVFETAVALGVEKIVFPSSGGTVYGPPQQDPIPETHPTDPLCSYGIGKLAIEKYLALFRHLHGLRYTILRIANAYGPFQSPESIQGAVGVFLGCALRRQPVSIWGDGTVVRDFVYASDVADAFLRAASSEVAEGPFNISSGKGVSLNEVVETIRAVTGRTLNVEYSPGRAFDVPRNVLGITRAKQEMSWTPRTSLKEGIERTWEWLLKHAES